MASPMQQFKRQTKRLPRLRPAKGQPQRKYLQQKGTEVNDTQKALQNRATTLERRARPVGGPIVPNKGEFTQQAKQTVGKRIARRRGGLQRAAQNVLRKRLDRIGD